MLKIIRQEEETAFIKALEARKAEASEMVRVRTAEILSDIRQGGWEAVCRWSDKLDHAEPREITASEIEESAAMCEKSVLDAMTGAAERIRDYQSRLMPKGELWPSADGGKVGQLIRGMTTVGMYVPGGTAAYPSSVLMNAVPAKVAGVSNLIMVTPPTKFLKKEVLAAAKIAGVDRVFAIGGVQAAAALAFGLGPVPKADKIVGPGNAYVAEAKRQLYGVIDIDMVAGPSEILIIADHSAEPGLVAADMLSQAEHDVLASSILVTTSPGLAEKVAVELTIQLASLPRAEIARSSLESFGACIVCESLEKAAELANTIAPEHLEILTEEPESLLGLIFNAGAVFLGSWSPEPLGDYWAGPSHVLPTSGTARFFSPLSVDSFLKKTSVVAYDRPSLEKAWRDIARLASCEGLDAHARAVERRFLK